MAYVEIDHTVTQLDNEGRLTTPLLRCGSRLEPSSWAASIDMIAERVA
jgi:predicted molibdopterin-dependent oxidoreductase YjgC